MRFIHLEHFFFPIYFLVCFHPHFYWFSLPVLKHYSYWQRLWFFWFCIFHLALKSQYKSHCKSPYNIFKLIPRKLVQPITNNQPSPSPFILFPCEVLRRGARVQQPNCYPKETKYCYTCHNN